MTSPPERDRQFAYFRAVGDGDPDDVSRLLGLEPDESWQAGDRFEAYGRSFRRKRSVWRRDSGLGDDQPLTDHIDVLLELLGDCAEGLRTLRETFHIEVVCVGFAYQTFYADLALPRLRRATALGISFSFDAYGFGDHHEQMGFMRELLG
ncbi:MAG: DUF4279 domain-containing protein [Rhodobiaceae bacterium]|nr:DUF4279 domain-containing protein [Rhodobiaceae bacterium]